MCYFSFYLGEIHLGIYYEPDGDIMKAEESRSHYFGEGKREIISCKKIHHDVLRPYFRVKIGALLP